ncbi:MAG: hypothetical protein LBT32_09990 [Peptococcaceae bacterium]|jgi:hypothetical protein|nr:hypothetical protein [Peptococcaceae bacterium]
MLNRRVFSLIVLLLLSVGLLWWHWQTPQWQSLPVAEPMFSQNRWTLDLNGEWRHFSSLRQAWAFEERLESGRESRISPFNGRTLDVPSGADIAVISKQFDISGEWSARACALELYGVRGHAQIYLNGIHGENLLVELDGGGGVNWVEIPPAMLHYGTKNTLLIRLSLNKYQRLSVDAGLLQLDRGKIQGGVTLIGVRQPMIAEPQISYAWQDGLIEITAVSQLMHYGHQEFGPWEVTAEILAEGVVMAQTDQLLQDDGRTVQPLDLRMILAEPQMWTPQDPHLYQMKIQVINALGDQDDILFSFGLRQMDRVGDVWRINGLPLRIQGVSLSGAQENQIRADNQIAAWLTQQLEQGMNVVYFKDVFPAELWLQTADRVGMGLWVETPVQMIPSPRLGAITAEDMREMFRLGNRHPSLWIWTVSKGLDEQAAATKAFEQNMLELLPAGQLGYTLPMSLLLTNEPLRGAWGEVRPIPLEEELDGARSGWPEERAVAIVWALLSCIVCLKCLFSTGWRYRDINENKPKRALRRAWFWYGLAFFVRESLLAGVLTSLLFRIPAGFSAWVSDRWPLIEILQYQNPWLIWLALAVFLALLRLVQIGGAAANLPEKPGAMGLVYWLERRYFWAFVPAFLWMASFWRIPFYLVPFVYLLLLALFLPVRIRDIRKAGGRYLLFLTLPAVLTIFLLIGLASQWAGLVYLYQLI